MYGVASQLYISIFVTLVSSFLEHKDYVLQGMVYMGVACLGMARLDVACLGLAYLGVACLGMACLGMVFLDVAYPA